MNTVLVTSRSFSSGSLDIVAELQRAGCTVVFGDVAHEAGELTTPLARADAWIAGTSPVTREHLALAPRLKIIARYGVGYESVDLASAASRGVIVTNTPGANSAAVADHALGLMLTALRGISAGDRRVRRGDWSTRRGSELGAQTVGIVGFGRIGQAVAKRLSGFAPRILACDPATDPAAIRAGGGEPATFQDILREATLISLHAPGGETLIDSGALSQIRPGTVLINCARADLIDEDALAAALRSGTIAAFAADTVHGDVAGSASPLLSADLVDTVTITPHLGAQTVQAVDAMGQMAAANVLAVLGGGEPSHPVSQ